MQGSHAERVTLLSVEGVFFCLHVECVPVNVNRHVFECYTLLLKEVNFCILVIFYQALIKSFDRSVDNLHCDVMVVAEEADTAAAAAVLRTNIGDGESDVRGVIVRP
jgi:hypothetical protein